MKQLNERTLWSLTRGQRLRYASAIGLLGLEQLVALLVPRISGVAIDSSLAAKGTDHGWLATLAGHLAWHPLWTAAALLVLVTIAGGGLHFSRVRGAAVASQAIARRLRDRLFAHIAEMPRAWHDGAETGDLVQRCSSDVETVRVFLSGQVVEIGRAVLLLLCVIPLMLALDVRMTLFSVFLFPVVTFFAFLFFRRVKRLFKAADEAEGRMTTVLQENLTGIRVVRAFARQEFEGEKFGKENAEFRDRTDRLLRALAAYWSLSDVVCLTQIGVVLFAGAFRLVEGRITVGTLFTFLLYAGLVVWPVRHLGRVIADTGKALVSLRRIREILAVEPESDLGTGAVAAPATGAGEIRIRDLSFAFREGEPVLRGISLTVRPGETVALVGPPGCGKSVLLNLLLRLYDYEEGAIELDGRELRTMTRREVRSRFGVVLQEPFLYSRTIEENLRVGRAGASEAELHAAARDAAIHDSIRRFEDGYDTVLGERGVTLSGGQRQRVALARALLMDPDILLLDDALSAVDSRTERAILDALEARHGKRTTILVSHRLSSIAAADRICVLDRGRIVQSGTHAELSRTEGPYRRLWRIQGALEEEIERHVGPGGRAG